MSGDSVEPGELLWIDPSVYRVPDLPEGFGFHVGELLGWGGEDVRRRRLVWVRGPVLDARGVPGDDGPRVNAFTLRDTVPERVQVDHARRSRWAADCQVPGSADVSAPTGCAARIRTSKPAD